MHTLLATGEGGGGFVPLTHPDSNIQTGASPRTDTGAWSHAPKVRRKWLSPLVLLSWSSFPLFFGLDEHFDHTKRSKIVATRHVSEAQNYQNCGRRSAPDPAGEAYSAPQTHWMSEEWDEETKREGERRRDRENGEKGREEREGLSPISLQKYAC